MRRKRTLVLIVVGLLATASAAWAFSVLTGVGGSTGGNFTTTVNSSPAITVATNGTVPDLDAGQFIDVPVKITNTASVSETLTSTASFSFTTTPAACASHLTFTGQDPDGTGTNNGLSSGRVYSPGQVVTEMVRVTADASTPATCAGGTWSAAITATTNP